MKHYLNWITNGIVVGDGVQLEILKEKYPKIEFVGWKNSEEVIEYMKNARSLIFPSLLYECAPLTTLEALSIGLPCIVSDECAAIESIEENISGLRFKRNSIESLIEKIKIFEDNEFIKKVSNNAYKKYWENPFDINRYKAEIEKFYTEVLNDN